VGGKTTESITRAHDGFSLTFLAGKPTALMSRALRRVSLVALLLAVLPCTGSQARPSQAAASSWSVQPVAMPTVPTRRVSALACTSRSACTAVGATTDPAGFGVTLAERWQGKRWLPERPRDHPGASFSTLNDVSCTSPMFCIAVGSFGVPPPSDSSVAYVEHALVERWNGSTWMIQRAASGSALSSVSCASARDCIALGGSGAERWNGRRWSLQRAIGRDVDLSDVSCPSSHGCIAVGSRIRNNGNEVTWAQHWDGRRWSKQRIPSIQLDQQDFLSAVSCASMSSCVAIGEGDNGAFVERWNGRKWSMQPEVTDLFAPEDVSCGSESTCVLVGFEVVYRRGQPHDVPATYRWNGSGWVVHRLRTGLASVSCTSARNCIAVGSGAVRWNGRQWRTMHHLRTTAVPLAGALNAVSCSSPVACTAVGRYYGSYPPRNSLLADTWDGRKWRLSLPPLPSDTEPEEKGGFPRVAFDGVSCTAESACTAVGYFTSKQGLIGTLIERWDGSRWSIQPTPDQSGALQAVSCTSPSACVAVGASDIDDQGNISNQGHAIADVWDGKTWTMQLPVGTIASGLQGISCTSATACTAVGFFEGGPEASRTLAEFWDGSSWTIQNTPNPVVLGPNLPGFRLGAVSCTSATECFAIGTTDEGYSEHQLAESWNGSSWTLQTDRTIQSNPIPDGATDTPRAVSCSSANTCTVVGSFRPPDGERSQALTEVWNGNSFTPRPSGTPPGASSSQLSGVSCAGGTTCEAAGTFVTSGDVGDFLGTAHHPLAVAHP
jgi:hypothetical protein